MPKSTKRNKKKTAKKVTGNARTQLRNRARQIALKVYEAHQMLVGNCKAVEANVKNASAHRSLFEKEREMLKDSLRAIKWSTEKLQSADTELDEVRELTKLDLPLDEWLAMYELSVDGKLIEWEQTLTSYAEEIALSLNNLGVLVNE